MKDFKDFATCYKARCKKRQEQELRERFKIVERGTTLWLTLDGVAFREITKETDANSITALLSDARAAALTFNSL